MAFPKPVQEYWVTLLPQSDVQHTVHLWNGEEFEIPPPPNSKVYDSQQPSEPGAKGVKTTDWGPTTRGPLGYIAHARSGDKGSNANVGFWVRHRDEWDWLRSTLSIDTIKRLLADEYKQGNKIVSGPCKIVDERSQADIFNRIDLSYQTPVLSTSYFTIISTEA